MVRKVFIVIPVFQNEGSWAVMQELQRKRPSRITLIDLTRNFGQMSALLAGYNDAQGDCVVSMAADLQDPPEVVWQLIDAWLAGHKLVVASRTSRDDGRLSDWSARF